MNYQHIKKLLNSGTGQELKSFLISEAEKLNSINNIKNLDNHVELAIEIKANKKALNILKDIYSQILNWEDTEYKKQKEKYYS
jgi:hypothetical protein